MASYSLDDIADAPSAPQRPAGRSTGRSFTLDDVMDQDPVSVRAESAPQPPPRDLVGQGFAAELPDVSAPPAPRYDPDPQFPAPRGEFRKGLDAGVAGGKQMAAAAATIPFVGIDRQTRETLAAFDEIDRGSDAPLRQRRAPTGMADPIGQQARLYFDASPEERAALRRSTTDALASNKAFRDGIVEAWRRYGDEAKASQGKTVNFTDIRDLEGFKNWFAYNTGQGIPYLAASALSGIIGGAIGGPAGAAVGVGASGYGMGVGDIQSELMEKGIADRPDVAMAGAVPYAALDFLGPVGRTLRNLSRPVIEGVARNYFQRLGREIPANLVEEFINEAGQEIVKDAAVTSQTGEKFLTDESLLRWFNSGMAGAASAGPASVVSAIPGGQQQPQQAAQPVPLQGEAPSVSQETVAANIPQPISAVPAGAENAPVNPPVTPPPYSGTPQAGEINSAVAATEAPPVAAPSGTPPIAAPTPPTAAETPPIEITRPLEAGQPGTSRDIVPARPAPGTPEDFEQAMNDPRPLAEIAAERQRRDMIAAVAAEDGPEAAAAVGKVLDGQGTRTAPLRAETAQDIDMAAARAAEPTPAQAEAGNYRMGHVRIHGLDITIETPRGGTRTGMDAEGRPWSNPDYPAHYGYLKAGRDTGDGKVDVFVGDEPASRLVYVIDQIDPKTGKFDEPKAMIGFEGRALAAEVYQTAFPDGSGEARMGAITPMTVAEFQAWLKGGDPTKPLAYVQPPPARSIAPSDIAPAPPAPAQSVPPPGGQAAAPGLASGPPVPTPAPVATPDQIANRTASARGVTLTPAERLDMVELMVDGTDPELALEIALTRSGLDVAMEAAEIIEQEASDAERQAEPAAPDAGGADRTVEVATDEGASAERAAGEPAAENAPIGAQPAGAEQAEGQGVGTAVAVRTETTPAAPLTLRVGSRTYPVESVEKASRIFVAARDKFGEGASNTPTPLLVRDGKVIGYVSYNGRVWAGLPTDRNVDKAPIYDPLPPPEKPAEAATAALQAPKVDAPRQRALSAKEKRAEAERKKRDAAITRREAAKKAIQTRKANAGALNIVQTIAAAGGIKDTSGDLRTIMGRPNYMVPVYGALRNDKNGMDPDRAREMLVEAGFLPEGATLNDLYEAIDQTVRGKPVMSARDVNAQLDRAEERKAAKYGDGPRFQRPRIERIAVAKDSISDEQIVIPGAERVAAEGRKAAKAPQRSVAETPLFGGEQDATRDVKRADAERETKRQGKLFRPGDSARLRVAGAIDATVNLSPQDQARRDATLRAMNVTLRRMAGKAAPSASVFDRMMVGDQEILGVYSPADHLLALSMRSPDPIGTVRHETIHVMRQLGLIDDAAWSALSQAAERDGWLAKHAIDERWGDGLTREQAIEEAIAEEFGVGLREGVWKTGNAKVDAIFQRIAEFLRRVRAEVKRALAAAGVRGMSDADVAELVFSLIERGAFREGEITARARQSARAQAAWHGTPYTFDRFDISKIGSGEGAQAYGYGLYFAGKKEVAEHYRNTLTHPSTITADRQAVEDHGAEWERLKEVARRAREKMDRMTFGPLSGTQSHRDAIRERDAADDALDALYKRMIDETIARGGGRGRLYAVELAPKDDEYLLWDKPLAEQSEKVREALHNAGLPRVEVVRVANGWQIMADGEPQGFPYNRREDAEGRVAAGLETNNGMRTGGTGGDIYKRIAEKLAPPLPPDSPGTPKGWGYVERGDEGQPAASRALHAAGVRGIKYLDGSSRSKGDGTYNYVLFDDKDVEILAMYQMAQTGAQQAAARPESQRRSFLGTAIAALKGGNLNDPRAKVQEPHDIGLARKLLITPRTIGSYFPEFARVFRAGVRQFRARDMMISDFTEMARGYMEMPQASKEKINKVLEHGRMAGETYAPAADGTITVKNKVGGVGERVDKDAGSIAADVEIIKQTDKAWLLKQDGIQAAWVPKSVVTKNPDGKFIIPNWLAKQHGFSGEKITREVSGVTTLTKLGEEVKLTPDEARAYRAYRATMDTALDRFRDQVLREWGYDPADADAPKTSEAVEEIAKDTENAGERARLKTLADVLLSIQRAKKAGYVPFTRYGSHYVTVTSLQDGKRVVVHREHIEPGITTSPRTKLTRARLEQEGARVRKRLAEIYPPDRGFEISELREVTPDSLDDLPSFSDLDAIIGAANLPPEQSAKVMEAVGELIKKRGFRAHFIKSRNIPGYSTDLERSLADYIVGISGYLARREHMPDIEEAIAGIPAREPKLREYAKKWNDYIQNPSEELQPLRQAGFLMYLGGRISSALVNLSQIPVVAMPWLSMFSNPVAANAQIARAYKDVGMAIRPLPKSKGGAGLDVFDVEKLPEDVRPVVRAALKDGRLLPIETFDIMATARGRTPGARTIAAKTQYVKDGLAYSFQAAERLNRMVTFIAAYRLAQNPEVMRKINETLRKDGQWTEFRKERQRTPEDFATFSVEETQFMQGKINRSGVMRGPGTAIFQFKSFMLNYLELLARLGFFGAGSYRGGARFATMAGLMGMLVLTSGLMGLPGAEDGIEILEAIVKYFTGVDPQFERRIREAGGSVAAAIVAALGADEETQETARDVGKRVLARGPLRETGIDISQRVGQGRVAPQPTGGQFDPFWERAAGLLGIPASLALRIPATLTNLWKGDWLAAGISGSPEFIADAFRARQFATEGVKTRARGQLVMPPDEVLPDGTTVGGASNVAKRALGFQPTGNSRAREEMWAVQRAGSAANAIRAEFNLARAKAAAAVARAAARGDVQAQRLAEARLNALVEKIVRYNASASPANRYDFNSPGYQQQFESEMQGQRSGIDRKMPKRGREELPAIRSAY